MIRTGLDGPGEPGHEYRGKRGLVAAGAAINNFVAQHIRATLANNRCAGGSTRALSLCWMGVLLSNAASLAAMLSSGDEEDDERKATDACVEMLHVLHAKFDGVPEEYIMGSTDDCQN